MTLLLRGAPWVRLLCRGEGLLPAGPERRVISLLALQRLSLSVTVELMETPADVLLWVVRLFARETQVPLSLPRTSKIPAGTGDRNMKMRYQAHLVYPKTASLMNVLFIVLVMLCLCSKKASKPSFSCIYQNETRTTAFQYFQHQLSFSRGTEQY